MGESIGASRARLADVEQALWSGELNEGRIEQYHAAFRQLEQQIAAQGQDQRHRFVIVIPVADRPQHLNSCLDSLLHLCRAFGYGGLADGKYAKITVIVADDSGDPDNIRRHREIARQYDEEGIETLYFGLDEQIGQMDTLAAAEQHTLARILGNIDRAAFHHKGPSITRNIAYLRLNEIADGSEKLLFYFIDSDQEFRVKVSTPDGDRNVYAINFFYQLDRIFSETDAAILTGKVVGDPPVSPAVMAGNFLEDVAAFLLQIAEMSPAQACQFHGAQTQLADDASYHDMAALFGFKTTQASYRYPCTLKGEHDHSRCFSHFSSKLNRFFYGEHPTRKTYYQHEDLMAGVKPARTIYTGNYIFRPEGLKYFIPFATLKLRMAGPVLGRIIKAELAGRFVSANLPMLHKRTVRTTGQSEFRPGIVADTAKIDLSGEFERQFYGDVMLFTIEKLSAMGFPATTPARDEIVAALQATHESLHQQYLQKRQLIQERLERLQAILRDPQHWWNQSPQHAEAVAHFAAFAANIQHNFGAGARSYELIGSAENRARRHADILEAISRYAEDRQAWAEVLARHRKGA